MDAEWIDLGPLEGFGDGGPTLKKGGERRFVCVRDGDRVLALDDRCPHQGYPLSQGNVSGGVLTCEWHNWKFDLGTGACLFGGEPVRSYPTRVEGGRVHLDVALDPALELPRLERGLAAALVDDDAGRALREALRIGAFVAPDRRLGALGRGFELLARDGADRAEYGFDHGLALLADVCSWAERGLIGAEEGFALAATAITEPSRHLGARAVPAGEIHDAENPALVLEDLVAERRAEAELRVRAIARSKGAAAARDALLPYVARHVYDYGHGAIFLTKACELGERFPGAVESIFAAATVELAWATAETSLPPFKATQRALAELGPTAAAGGGAGPEAGAGAAREAGASAAREVGAGAPPGVAFDREALERAVLAGEKPALAATLGALRDGASPVALLRAVARAAAIRLSRFDRAWEARLDAEASVLDVTHLVTYAEAAIRLSEVASPAIGARLAVLAAGFTGRLKTGDRAGPDALAEVPAAPRASHATLAEAASARDLGSALAIAGGLDRRGRLRAYDELAPFCAFESATRPIRYVHAVKMTEAMRRLDTEDPDAGDAFLRALLSFVVPLRPERDLRRVAFVARKFLADGRPPEGLY